MNNAPLILALESLRRQKRRSLLTMLAIAIGIASVITIAAAGQGIEHFVLGQLEVFGPDTLSLGTNIPNTKRNQPANAIGQATGIVVTTLKASDLQTVRRHPNIRAAYGMVSGQETIGARGELKKVLLMGHGSEMPEVERVAVAEGRFYTSEEAESGAAVVALGSRVKEELFGFSEAVGQVIYLRGKPFRVVGTLAPRGAAFFLDLDNMVFIPTKTMQKQLLGVDYLQAIVGRVYEVDKINDTMADLTEQIRANHNITDPERDDFHWHTAADAASTLKTVTSGLTLLLLAGVGISLVVGGVGIMNIMYVSVAERTFEIGLRKAVGAGAGDILRQFLGEAVLITLGGGIIGIMLGAGLALAVHLMATARGFNWVYSIPVPTLALSVIFSAVIGLVFGMYPARRAAALNPIEALRRE